MANPPAYPYSEELMEWWQSAILGLVQGLTEFIPISSTAHLRIVPALLGWPDPGAAYSAVIQLGTLLALLVYFATDIARLTAAGLAWPVTRARRWAADGRLAWTIVAANIPIVVLGLAGRDFIETEARSLYLVGGMLIAVALALVVAERLAAQRATIGQLGFWRIQVIGLFQALALLPGASRSGSTLLGGLAMGLERAEAARFTFLVGAPAILGAGLLQLVELLEGLGRPEAVDATGLLAGLAVSAISGYASIDFLLRYLKRHTTGVFIVYRLALGAGILLLTYAGWIQ